MVDAMQWRLRGRHKCWLRRGGHAALLAVALVFVMMLTYLPHMDTLEGRVNPTGAVEGRSEVNPWLRLTSAYGQWVAGDWDDDPYPMHMDSFVHWTRASAIQREETVAFANPYTGSGGGEASQGLRGLVHESGFWLAFAQFQDMTGVPWLKLIQFAPMLFAGLTASLVWAALRPHPMAPLAAAFVALIPTTPRFLGIGFFVPIGIGLAWVAASLLLAQHAYRDPRYLILTLIMGAWAFFIHLIAGFAFVLVVTAASLPLWRENRGRTLFVAAGVALPFFAFYDRFQVDFGSEIERMGTLPIDFTVFDQLGVPFLLIWALGTTILITEPPRGPARVPAFAAALGSLVAIAFIVLNLAFDLQRYVLYDRWHQVFALLAVVPVAYAIYMGWRALRFLVVKTHGWIAARKGHGAPGERSAFVYAAVGLLVVVSAFGVVTSSAIGYHLDEPYYRVLNDDDWEAYNHAASLGPEYQVYLTHPWKAPAFNAITGKQPYAWLDPGSPPKNGADYEAYRSTRHADGIWLVERDITLVLDPVAPRDPAYETIAPGVHVLDGGLARDLYGARGWR